MRSRLLVFGVLCLFAHPLCAQLALGLAETKANAEKGDPKAMDAFGEVHYAQGNYSTAAEWFRKAAEKGVVNSQRRLGQLLLNGMTNVPRAPEEGFRWLLIAAVQGDRQAQGAVAGCYRDGPGVETDLVESYKWQRLANGQNVMATQLYLNPLIMRMTPEQVEEGEKRAKAFRPHKPTAADFPEPQYLKEVVLKGITGPAERRMAIINNKPIAAGEQVYVKLSTRTVAVKCIKIEERSATVMIEGAKGPKVLRMR